MNWFHDLFINEARHALSRHSGSGGTSEEPAAYILVDEAGNEVQAVLADEQIALTATTNDIREGTTAITENGLETGEKVIPSYNTTEGVKLITAGSKFLVKIKDGLYDYTKLQALICAYNSSLTDSVATDRVAIENSVYPVSSAEVLAAITVDADAESIDFGIVNDTENMYVIRYFTYKEEY